MASCRARRALSKKKGSATRTFSMSNTSGSTSVPPTLSACSAAETGAVSCSWLAGGFSAAMKASASLGASGTKYSTQFWPPQHHQQQRQGVGEGMH